MNRPYRFEDKVAAMLHLVREVVPANQLTILFTATRHHAEFLYTLLLKEGVDAACVFGSMDQVRDEAGCGGCVCV